MKVKLLAGIAFIAAIMLQVSCSDNSAESDHAEQKAPEKSASPEYTLVEGTDYAILQGKKASQEPHVFEFFSYTCPHCYNLEPLLQRWKANDKPDEVTFEQVPVFMGQVAHLTYGYYAALELGVKDKVHPMIFTEWHKNKNIIRTKSDLLPIFEKAGVSKEAFEQAYNSDAVKAKVNRAINLAREFSITSFPQVIVNKKYQVRSYENINDLLGPFAIDNTQ